MPYSSLIRTITALYNLNNLVKTTRKLVKKKSQTTNFLFVLVNLFENANENAFQYNMIPYQKIFDCLYKQVFQQAL